MPPKRPQLEQLHLVTRDNPVSITDTMTLVVKGENGYEMRVKETGIAPRPDVADVATTRNTTQAVMNKLSYDDLKVGPEIGKGSQGKVRVVQHRQTRVKYALKCIDIESDSEEMRKSLEAELRQVAAVKHDNVVSSYEAFFRDGRVYIVLEYMDKGTMADVIKRHPEGMNEEILAYIARELFKGLEFIHSLHMIHRDIKPANVLANSRGQVKISDFGVAKTFQGTKQQTLSAEGSTPYMSPERIQSQAYSYNSDIWSAGLIIAECALGEYPFADLKSRIFELCQAIASGTARINWERSSRQFSDEFRNFVEICLQPAESRPDATQMLQQPFIGKADSVNPSAAGEWF